MKELGIYVHIPFCKKKCNYCDFISFQNKSEYIEKYICCLKKEIQESTEIKSEDEIIVKTIYIGGGTPSYIDSKYILDVMKIIKNKYKIYDTAEITIEVNPGTITEQKLKDYHNIGINRLSIGLQSDNDEILKNIGRIHTYSDFLYTYKLARKVGFKNVNVDLMLGLPNQTIQILENTVNNIIKLEPEHISIYSLILEEGTKLEEQIANGKINLPDENTERTMYHLVKEILEQNEFIQYEISNFCKKGFESKHNLDCWKQKEYIGFGVAAHSYINMKRFSNIENIEKYIKNIDKENIENNYIIHEVQDKTNQMKEYMMLGLRKIGGISITEFEQKFNQNPIYLYRIELNRLVNEELLEVDGDNMKLTLKGLDFANLVWEEFV